MQPRTPIALIAALAALAVAPARANDSIAELATGGISLTKTAEVVMESEYLRLSPSEVAVDYKFRNLTGRDITATVAFPMPDIQGSEDFMVAVPQQQDNFLGFTVTQDGKPITPQLQQQAFAGPTEVTVLLRAAGVPLLPFGDATAAALARLPEATAKDWEQRGLIALMRYDDGSGWKTEAVPLWRLRSAYHWQTVFPAGRSVAVAHRYKPALGQSVGLRFVDENGRPGGPDLADYNRRYCMDDAFKAAVAKRARPDALPGEARLAYVLGTGGHWASGRIGQFTLEVDKGRPDALVSFCGTGVKKIGPTRFRMEARDFAPTEMLEVLIANPPT